ANVQQRVGRPGRPAHGGTPADVGHVAVPAGSQVDENHLALHQRPAPRLPVLQPGLNPADHAGRKGFARAKRMEPRDARRRHRGLQLLAAVRIFTISSSLFKRRTAASNWSAGRSPGSREASAAYSGWGRCALPANPTWDAPPAASAARTATSSR